MSYNGMTDYTRNALMEKIDKATNLKELKQVLTEIVDQIWLNTSEERSTY